VDEQTQDAIWREIPHLVTPLQERLSRLSGVLNSGMGVVSSHRIERAMEYQRVAGDYYWMALEEEDPAWLEDRYDGLHRELELDGGENWCWVGTAAHGPACPVRRPAGAAPAAVRR
jgi:hypothetical protein